MILEFIFVVLAVSGSYCMAHKKITGYYFWLAADVLGIPFGIYNKLYLFAALNVLYAALSLYGLRQWRKSSND